MREFHVMSFTSQTRMSNNKLFVGSLPFSVRDEQLAQHFSQAGTVTSATVMMDKMTGRSRGFGFVEMSTDEEAEEAIKMFNNNDFEGRPIIVNIARPKTDRPPRRDFGGSRGGGGGYRDNGGYGGRRDY